MGRLVARGRLADVDMGARGRPQHRPSKSNERNPGLAQVGYERAPLAAVRVHRHVHGVVMIESEAVMSSRRAESRDRQGVAGHLLKEFFDLRRLCQ